MGYDDVGGSGYSLEELSAYAEAGRTPRIAAIESNAECQAVLAALERAGSLSRELLDEEGAREPEPGWIDELLARVWGDVRAGRDIPLGGADGVALYVTEGAVREAMRAAADGVDGVLAASTHLSGDLAAGGEVDAEVAVSVEYGTPLRAAAERVRDAVATAIARVSPLVPRRVDVRVVRLHRLPLDVEGDDHD